MKYVRFKNFFIIGFIFLLAACVKETSYESGANLFGPSGGSLKDSLGDCKGIVVKGKYSADSVLTDSNFILIQVTITSPGNYSIYSDTANGFWFRDSGYSVAGNQTLKIRGYGKPILPLNTDFDITYNNSVCSFTVSLITPPSANIYRDYFPTTVGSNWAYDIAGFADTLHIDASNKDSIIGGNTYRVFYGFRGTTFRDTGFYRKVGNNYFRYDALDMNSGKLELLYLKDDQPILNQWISPIANTVYNSIPTEIRMSYTLLSVHQPRVVNGISFDSVIQVRNDLQYKIVGTFQTIQTFTTYFAKNVGVVELDVPGVYNQRIRRWKVY